MVNKQISMIAKNDTKTDFFMISSCKV